MFRVKFMVAGLETRNFVRNILLGGSGDLVSG